METFDVAVIGAGIAGVSVAAELAAKTTVVVLERETQPAYHTSGRSAALFATNNGNPLVRALSVASEDFYRNPPDGFVEYPLLSPRGMLMIGRQDQEQALARFHAGSGKGAGKGTGDNASKGSSLPRLDEAQTREKSPLLRADYGARSVWDAAASDIDVHGLLQAYLKVFRRAGGILRTQSEVAALRREGNGWRIATGSGDIAARVVINAAGAWADEVATVAGLRPLGLQPMRRTALIVDPPDKASAMMPPLRDWPMTIDVDEQFYLKPEAGMLLVSPAEETPMPPQDIQPDELDVAICIERIERAFDLNVRHVKRKWAGLRTFTPDRAPVVGFEPGADGFFWLAGQGGYGYQTAPALSQTAACLVLRDPLPAAVAAAGVSAVDLSVERFR
ncbi:MAG: FAD-binding oxidoreductase [Hyphomicrobiales bacterium]|nr:FAD-binding oxidoreductase [Hyphomicrobiales bacterium]